MSTTEPLVAADELLSAYYETLFRAVLERHRSPGGAPPPEAPPEFVKFSRFQPAKAVSQPQVRKALRAMYDDDPELPALVAGRHRCRGVEQPDVDAVVAAAAAGDRALLERIASCVAATRPPGWEAVLSAAAAAVAALAAGRASGEAVATKRVEDEARRATSAAERADQQRQRLRQRSAELTAVRSQRDEARAAVEEHARTAGRLRERVDAVQADVGELRLERDALLERVRHLESGLRGQEGSSRETERHLRARIDDLESALIPDLEPHAVALERLAGELRETVRRLTSGEGTRRVRRRKTPEIPKGVVPDSADAARWALRTTGLVIVVDGYNVTKQPERGWAAKTLEDQRQMLVSRCCQVRRRDGAELRVVFDSSDADSPGWRRRLPDGVVVEFSGGPIADDAIVDLVGGLDVDIPVVVVTSDRELQSRVAARGAVPVPSPAFLEAIDAPRR